VVTWINPPRPEPCLLGCRMAWLSFLAALSAIVVQRAFKAYSESHPDTPMRVRIGLHVGPAIDESSDLW
jgi:hypothetical protein